MVLLAVLVVLWIAVLLAWAVAFAVRPIKGRRAEAWPRWIWWAAGVSAILLAVVLPALAVVYSTGTREHRSHTGVALTDEMVRGRDLFGSACKRCHTLGDVGAASTIGPNLDVLQPDFDTVVDAVVNGRARGNGQMPAGLADRPGAEAVAAYIEAVAGRPAKPH